MSHITHPINNTQNFKSINSIVNVLEVLLVQDTTSALGATSLRQVQGLIANLKSELTNGASVNLDSFKEIQDALDAAAAANGVTTTELLASLATKVEESVYEAFVATQQNFNARLETFADEAVIRVDANTANITQLQTDLVEGDDAVRAEFEAALAAKEATVTLTSLSAWTVDDGVATVTVANPLSTGRIGVRVKVITTGELLSYPYLNKITVLNGQITITVDESIKTHSLSVEVSA